MKLFHATRRFYFSTIILVCFTSSFNTPKAQEDLSESHYPEAVRYVVARGVIQSSPLRLQENVTRAELAVIAYRLAGAAQPGAVRCFSDVPKEAWYNIAVCSLAGQGIISGFEDSTFRPKELVEGADVLKIIMAAFDITLEPTSSETTGSPPIITPWYTPYLQLASELGLANIEADRPITRDNLAQFIFSLYRLRAMQQSSVANPQSSQRDNAVLSSSGCGKSSEALRELQSSGVTRSVITALPEAYDAFKPHQLIFAFHGRTSDNAEVQRYYGLEPNPNSILVYPRGLGDSSGFSWGDGETVTDVRLFDDLLETYASTYCVDLAKVFVVGHSLGASYTTSLGCVRGDRIRAVAALGGGISENVCKSRVAAMILHNPEDNLVPVSEGERARNTFLEQNGLPLEPLPSEPNVFNCSRYGSDGNLYPVIWCLQPVSTAFGEYYPHTWPQGLGTAILDFFGTL
ncbi:MAG: S-layer homology domain-containing protein [Trueperaceae bacterium]